MPLTPGTRLGPYEVTGLLGAGGMGEVYRARDLRPALAREVAIKVLADTAVDAASRHRFEQEARATAALNHPHILGIYDVGTHEGHLYLVEEFVDGTTLRETLGTGPLPVRRAVEIARAIAQGLAAAHARGIVHRDLKPENVMLTRDGRVKILDFGLAKVGPTAPLPEASTQTHATGPGTVLGTVSYMSPEQVRGQALDHRSDLFSLGVVLYELLSGTRPFGGATAPDTQAAILNAQPREFQSSLGIPPALQRIVDRCLEKQPELRFQSASDLAFALESLITQSSGSATQASHSSYRRLRDRAGWLAAGLVALIGFGWNARGRQPAESILPVPETRLELTTPQTADPGALAVSPDGRKIVFSGQSDTGLRLWMRSLDSSSAVPLQGTEGGQAPFWSPDGQSLGFFAQGKLKRLNPDGSVRVLGNAPGVPSGGTWNRRGDIVFSLSAVAPLYRVQASGGPAVQATKLQPSQVGHLHPFFLDDDHFLFRVSGLNNVRGIYVGQVGSDQMVRILDVDGAYPRVMAGRLLYTSGTRLLAMPFDGKTRTVSGSPVVLADVVSGSPGVSANGTLAYRTGTGVVTRQLIWFDRSGREVARVGEPDSSAPSNLTLSSDDRTLLVQRTVGGNTDIWSVDTARGALSRMTAAEGSDLFPVWAPDGQQFAFASTRDGQVNLYLRSLTAPNESRLLVTSEPKDSEDWSRDGRWILFRNVSPKSGNDLWVLPTNGDRKPVPFVQTEFDERGGQFSPDGRWVAFQSDESGRFEIYVQPFPGPGPKIAVSTNGGAQVRWRSDGRELFYVALDGRLMSVPVSMSGDAGAIQLGAATALFSARLAGSVVLGFGNQQYVVSRDGQRFLVNTVVDTPARPVAVILNWRPQPPGQP